jgi:hypothetical protein
VIELNGTTQASLEECAALVRTDPLTYLRHVAQRCRELEQYTFTFTRQERRGLFRSMHGPEHMRGWFRRDPFSVRLKWLDEDVKYGESAYVEGRNDSKVRFVTRWWSPPLLPPPSVNQVGVMTPVYWGESRSPLTDFGLERLIERTLETIDRAGDDALVRYEGPRRLAEGGPPVHYVHIEVPVQLRAAPVQELFIDAATDLPVGTVIKSESGEVQAAYFYDDLDTTVTLSDGDFLLSVEQNATAPREAAGFKGP